MEKTTETSVLYYGYPEALHGIKNGEAFARKNWNGKGMFIYLNKGSAPLVYLGEETINGVDSNLFEFGDVGTAVRMPNLNMKAADGSIVTGWLASQTDQLACDWVRVSLLTETTSDQESLELLEKLNA